MSRHRSTCFPVGKDLQPPSLPGLLELIEYLLPMLQAPFRFPPLYLLLQPVLRPLQLLLSQSNVVLHLSMLQYSVLHVHWLLVRPLLLPLLFFQRASLLRSRRVPFLRRTHRCCWQLLVPSQATRVHQRRLREFTYIGYGEKGSKEAFLSCSAAVRWHCSRRPQWRPSPAHVAIVLSLSFVCWPCFLPDHSQRLPDAQPPASAPPTASVAPSAGAGRDVGAVAGKKGMLNRVVLVVAAFKCLIPPSPPGSTDTGGKTHGPWQLFALPPTLQLSGADSLYCSCQHGKTTQSGARAPGLRGSSTDFKDRKNTSQNTSEGTKVDTIKTQDGRERSEGRSSSSATTGELGDEEWCCGLQEKQEALNRVFDAADGIAFVSIGDTGQPGTQLGRGATTLGDLSRQVNLRYVNLLGDNFYPQGVYSTSDPLWRVAFNDAFNHPALQKVAFFPVLGNHDYGLNPYAQIERYVNSTLELQRDDGITPPRRLSAGRLYAPSHPGDSGYSIRSAPNQGVAGDRWRFPNYWYFTRHVFTNVPYNIANPYKVGMNIDDAYELNLPQGEGRKVEVVVVTVYIDTMVLIADEQKDYISPYNLSKDEIYFLQLDFIEDVLAQARRDADWIFICGHHPVMTDGDLGRNLPEFAARMKELMGKYGVDAYVSGHEHMLSFFRAEAGTDGSYIISGSGSKRNAPVTCRRKSCMFNSAKPGFVLHLLSKTELHHIFIDNYGKVLFTQTQYVKQRERVPGQTNILAYPNIRRVYIGPSDQWIELSRPRFAPHYYFLFGALTALVCMLLVAVVLWLIRTLKRRKLANVPAFTTRLPVSQTEQAPNDAAPRKDIFLVPGKAVQPRLPGRQDDMSGGEHQLVHKPGQETAESPPTSRVLSKSKSSFIQGTLRRSSLRQPQIAKKETAASASLESQSLLGVSPLDAVQIPGCERTYRHSKTPPVGETLER